MRNIHEFEVKNLLRMANDAKERAYVPYSGFRVGACLKGASGAYYFGCNKTPPIRQPFAPSALQCCAPYMKANANSMPLQ